MYYVYDKRSCSGGLWGSWGFFGFICMGVSTKERHDVNVGDPLLLVLSPTSGNVWQMVRPHAMLVCFRVSCSSKGHLTGHIRINDYNLRDARLFPVISKLICA